MMSTRIMLDAALRYADLGISILPIRPGSKVPYTEHGVHDATTNSLQIECWWQQWPRADIALACGAVAGFDVLDVDRQHGGIGRLDALVKVHGPVPATARQRTPSGGFHLLFAHRPGLKNRSGGQGDAPLGLDCRTTGGMIKAAPTTGYRWIERPDHTDLPPWPDWLAAFYREREMPSPATTAPRHTLPISPEHADQVERYVLKAIMGIADEIAAAKPGCQEPTLNGGSFRVGRLVAAVPDLAAESVIQQLFQAGMAMENEVGRRPWTVVEIERSVRRGLEDGKRQGPAVLPVVQG